MMNLETPNQETPEQTGGAAVLLLDDIFAELDKSRRGAVADVIREKQCQVFVATPRAEDLPFKANAKIVMDSQC